MQCTANAGIEQPLRQSVLIKPPIPKQGTYGKMKSDPGYVVVK